MLKGLQNICGHFRHLEVLSKLLDICGSPWDISRNHGSDKTKISWIQLRNTQTVGRYTFIACGHNVHLISRSLDNICHYYAFYLSGDVLLSLNKLDLNSSNVHTILAAITGPVEVTYTCICISYTEISLMVQFSSCLKFYSPLFQKSPSFKNPHFQHNAKCKLTFLVEITLI